MIVLTTRRPEINSRIETEGTYTTIPLATFKEFLKWDASDTSEDTTMTAILKSTIKAAEMYTGRAIDRATWRTYLDSFYDFTFDVAPIVTTSGFSVKYFNSSNVEQTLGTTNYTLVNNGNDAYARIEFEGSLPDLYDRHEPVYLEYLAGYTTYPPDLVDIILHEAATRFEHRTNQQSGALGDVIFGFHQRLFPWKLL